MKMHRVVVGEIAPAHHRLFIVASNELMVMMDSTTGTVLSTLPIGRLARSVNRRGRGVVY